MRRASLKHVSKRKKEEAISYNLAIKRWQRTKIRKPFGSHEAYKKSGSIYGTIAVNLLIWNVLRVFGTPRLAPCHLVYWIILYRYSISHGCLNVKGSGDNCLPSLTLQCLAFSRLYHLARINSSPIPVVQDKHQHHWHVRSMGLMFIWNIAKSEIKFADLIMVIYARQCH